MDLGFEGDFDVLSHSLNEDVHPDWIERKDSRWARLPSTRFKAVFANDIMPAARAAWVSFFGSRGNSDNDFVLESIVDLVKRHKNGEKVFPAADVVTGGFPCQDFSVAGKRNGFNSHKAHHGGLLKDGDAPTDGNRGKLYMWMREVIDIVRPKIFIAENVKGLVSLADAKKIIENDFRSIGDGGYLVVDARVLFAPDYGVPQTRERVIFIGFKKSAMTKAAIKELSKVELSPEYAPYPIKTHGKNGDGRKSYVTVKQALTGLSEPEAANDLAQKWYSRAKWYGDHCQGQSEVDLDGLGPTIRAEHHGNIEFRRLSLKHGGRYESELKKGLTERRLTVRECARIQTFPDNFEFVRKPNGNGNGHSLSSSDGYRVVGNAVPPLLAFHVAWRLQEIWPKIFKKG
ncbi:modification methylase BepI [Candidatus Omnitrophus magneticus]|uniref:Cytosine-specific methyltransferase n=1 Tax=Candidatus Omnitrophus magneticus TaxID=1609969 RepID=A0A0F0CSH6_9BACT|nr:modification methylase BepI [Candidatus Omnitrophus magneticus]